MKVDGIKESKRIYALILTVVAFLLSLKGITLPAELQVTIVEWIDTVVIAISGGLIAWSKLKELFKAKKETKKPIKKLIIEGLDDES